MHWAHWFDYEGAGNWPPPANLLLDIALRKINLTACTPSNKGPQLFLDGDTFLKDVGTFSQELGYNWARIYKEMGVHFEGWGYISEGWVVHCTPIHSPNDAPGWEGSMLFQHGKKRCRAFFAHQFISGRKCFI